MVIGDVVAVVLERGREERQDPDAGNAELLEVVQLLDQPPKVADAIAIAVVEGTDVELVDDCVLVPERVVVHPSVVQASARVIDRHTRLTRLLSERRHTEVPRTAPPAYHGAP